jgi:hypothetical protein
MSIKLRYDQHPVHEGARVWTEDRSLAPIGGLLGSDIQSHEDARDRAAKMKEVVAGTREPYAGSGNAYYTSVGREFTEVGLDDRDDPITISVRTADLIAAIEEWAAHLEQRLKTTGSYL